MFSIEIYRQRRRILRDRMAGGLLLLPGHRESPINFPSNPYPFRQDSTFLYYFGLRRPQLTAVIDLDEGRECLYGDDPTVEQMVWTGRQTPLAEQAAEAGVENTAPSAALPTLLTQARRAGRTIHYLPPIQDAVQTALAEWLDIPHAEAPAGVSESFIRAVVAQRSIKSQEEIDEIARAIDVTRRMQVLAMQAARPGTTEQQILGQIEGLALAEGCRTSFPTIFTIRGEILHNQDFTHTLNDSNLALNDCGAESPEGYAGDLTRTFPVSGRFSARQRDVYEIVLRAQQQAIAMIRPGVEFRQVHRRSCIEVAAGLQALGLMKGDPEQAVEEGAHTLFLPCGLGHMLGLDVHDMEGLGEDYVGYTDTVRRRSEFGWCSLRLGRPLEAGFVVTVEPGVYFIPELIGQWRSQRLHENFVCYDRLDDWLDFGGVRIEDDILVTADGCRNLSADLPKAVDEIEDLCRRA